MTTSQHALIRPTSLSRGSNDEFGLQKSSKLDASSAKKPNKNGDVTIYAASPSPFELRR